MEQVIKISTSASGTAIIAKRGLVIDTDPILKEKTPEFNFKHPPIHPTILANELVDVLQEHKAVGLAAPQIGYSHRAFVMGMGNQIVAFFNPKILEASKETEFLQEGCLTFPGLFIKIRRPKQIHVAYTDHTGKHHETKFSGLTARIFQHELDHLDGVLFTQKADTISLDIARRKLKKNKEKNHGLS